MACMPQRHTRRQPHGTVTSASNTPTSDCQCAIAACAAAVTRCDTQLHMHAHVNLVQHASPSTHRVPDAALLLPVNPAHTAARVPWHNFTPHYTNKFRAASAPAATTCAPAWRALGQVRASLVHAGMCWMQLPTCAQQPTQHTRFHHHQHNFTITSPQQHHQRPTATPSAHRMHHSPLQSTEAQPCALTGDHHRRHIASQTYAHRAIGRITTARPRSRSFVVGCWVLPYLQLRRLIAVASAVLQLSRCHGAPQPSSVVGCCVSSYLQPRCIIADASAVRHLSRYSAPGTPTRLKSKARAAAVSTPRLVATQEGGMAPRKLLTSTVAMRGVSKMSARCAVVLPTFLT